MNRYCYSVQQCLNSFTANCVLKRVKNECEAQLSTIVLLVLYGLIRRSKTMAIDRPYEVETFDSFCSERRNLSLVPVRNFSKCCCVSTSVLFFTIKLSTTRSKRPKSTFFNAVVVDDSVGRIKSPTPRVFCDALGLRRCIISPGRRNSGRRRRCGSPW